MEKLEMQVRDDPGSVVHYLLPVDMPLAHLRAIELDAVDTTSLRQGKSLDSDASQEEVVRVYTDDEFIGIGEIRADGRLYAKRLLSY
jgi:tRNA U55 pseudouridine synthase TruB